MNEKTAKNSLIPYPVIVLAAGGDVVGLGLLVLFFVIGVMKTLGSFAEVNDS